MTAAAAVTEPADSDVHGTDNAGTHGCSSAGSLKMSEDAADSSGKDEESKCADDDDDGDDNDDDDENDNNSGEEDADAQDVDQQ